MMVGIAQMECSAAVAIGDLISGGTDGRAKTAATGERVIGLCVGKATTVAGQ